MKNRLVAIVVTLCVCLLAATLVADYLYGKNAADNFLSMNTTVRTNITGLNSDKANEKIKSEIIRLDSKLLSRTNSGTEIYKVNSGAQVVSDELASILTTLKEIEKDSGGAFCVGLGALSDLWGIGTDNAKVPAKTEIDAAIKNAGKWTIDGNTVYVPEGVKLDMGAIGKGLACDYANTILAEYKCRQAIIAVGGSVAFYGKNTTAEIAIRDPLGNTNDYCAILKATSDCFSTSGNYERFFEDENGNRYHHIFDPKTGYPVENELMSVTVIAQQGIISDALSTACFVLGIEKSLPLLEKYNAHAIFITKDKEFITTYGNLEKEIITITNNEYKFGELK